jgi:hypothetical protein
VSLTQAAFGGVLQVSVHCPPSADAPASCGAAVVDELWLKLDEHAATIATTNNDPPRMDGAYLTHVRRSRQTS